MIVPEDARRFAGRALGSWRRRRGTTPPAVDATGFYAATTVGPGPRGAVLATESMSGPAGATTWRVRYRTLDAADRPVVASMAIAAPTGPAATPRPVVAWVHGAVGVAPGCGPSRTGFDAWYGDRLLGEGCVVVAPDLTGLGVEGSTHPYLHGLTAGRAVLDAVRAAAELSTTGAGPVTALAGHSAGGHAVLWANELAATAEGDGLDVRLAVPMSPIGDLTVTMARYADDDGRAAFPVQLAATWADVEPVVPADALTPAALARLDDLHTKRLAGLQHTFRGHATRWIRPGGLTTGAWAAALERQSAGRRPGAAPVLLVHGEADDDALVGWTTTLAETIRTTGTEVTLRTYPATDHMAIHDAAQDDVLASLSRALGDDG
ncbi:MAG: prolyl oligopeptidase family serine peptidase [Ilumatobacteraceae bacterium]